MVGDDDRDGLGHRGQFYRPDPHYWRHPDRAPGAVCDPMAADQKCQIGPGFHERDVDRLWLGIGIAIYNWVIHDRPLVYLGLGLTILGSYKEELCHRLFTKSLTCFPQPSA